LKPEEAADWGESGGGVKAIIEVGMKENQEVADLSAMYA